MIDYQKGQLQIMMNSFFDQNMELHSNKLKKCCLNNPDQVGSSPLNFL